MTALVIEYEARGATPKAVRDDANRIAVEALDTASVIVQVGVITPERVITTDGRQQIIEWRADVKAWDT